MFDHMLEQNTSIIEQYCQHLFNQELYNGTLPDDRFKWFLRQDAIYLKAYANVLLRISERLQSEHPDDAKTFLRFKEETIAAEQYVNSTYFPESSLPFFKEKAVITKPATVIQEYIAHLEETAKSGTIIEAIAACYPCFYLYAELGKRNKDHFEENKYSAWTTFYSDKTFLESTTLITKILTTMLTSSVLSEKEQNDIIEKFTTSAKFEVQFCDAALKQIVGLEPVSLSCT